MKFIITALSMLILSSSTIAETKNEHAQSDKEHKHSAYFDFPVGVKVISQQFLFANKKADTRPLKRYLSQSDLNNKAFLLIPANFSVKYQHIIKILRKHSVAEKQIQIRFDLSKAYSLTGNQLLLQTEEFAAVTQGCNTNQIGCSTQSNYLMMLDNPRDLYRANKPQNIDSRSVLKTLKRLEKQRPNIGNNQDTRGN